METAKYAPFGLNVSNLGELEWREITLTDEDGRSWRVKEVAEGGASFRLQVSGRVSGQMGLGAVGEKITGELIKPVLVDAIMDYLARSGSPPKGQEVPYSVDVQHFRNAGIEPR